MPRQRDLSIVDTTVASASNAGHSSLNVCAPCHSHLDVAIQCASMVNSACVTPQRPSPSAVSGARRAMAIQSDLPAAALCDTLPSEGALLSLLACGVACKVVDVARGAVVCSCFSAMPYATKMRAKACGFVALKLSSSFWRYDQKRASSPTKTSTQPDLTV